MDAINPCPPEWLDNEDNALLRGDAIGDTVYTHRWILKCLFTIAEALPKYINENDAIKGPIENDASSEGNESTQEGEEIPDDNSNDIQKEETKQKGEKIPDNSNDIQKEETKQIFELDTEVEDAACQLWDMTVERDVSIHLLNLEEIDILQLATLIFNESCAPRLTEVMVGVVANLCCIEEGCTKILEKKEKNEVLLSVLDLLGSTSDVPTLCEVMRLIRLLIWYRVNRTPDTSFASCPLLKMLCIDIYRNAITFLLKNSLSDSLLSSLLHLLTSFLFICLPETGLNIASLYSTVEIIDGLIAILESKSFENQTNEEQEKILHLSVTCLYSFVDTPGERLIQLSSASSESKLESLLLTYVEHEGLVETLEELAGEVCDHVIRGIGLLQLLIPYMKRPSLIMIVGKLMGLVYGETRQYSVSRSSSRDEDEKKTSLYEAASFLSSESKKNRRQSREYKTQFSNPPAEECGWVSPPAACPPLVSLQRSSEDVCSAVPHRTSFQEEAKQWDKPRPREEESPPSEDDGNRLTSIDLSTFKDLADVLEDYCYQLLDFWWSPIARDESYEKKKRREEVQKDILDVLDQCHAHEVMFILHSVRLKEPTLVPKLQEQIIDSGSHQRLVTLLAHLYQ